MKGKLFHISRICLKAKRGDCVMKWQAQHTSAYARCYPTKGNRVLQIIGLVLIAVGLLLLFLCIPGWFWAALIGIILIVAGFLLLRLSGVGR